MTKQTINLGTAPAGKDGDTARSGFTKVNSNFDEIYARAQGKLAKDVSGAAGTMALSAAEALNGFIDLFGALTGNRIVTVPAAPAQGYTVRNRTTGAFVLTFSTSSGGGVVVQQGSTSELISDGENIIDPLAQQIGNATGRLKRVRVLTSSGTFTSTPGTKMVLVRLQAAGGAGGGTAGLGVGEGSIGSSGGSGGYSEHLMTSGFDGVAYVVGAGPAGVVGGNGPDGGNSSFAGITVTGGKGGRVSAPGAQVFAAAAQGGTASGANVLNRNGEPSSSAWLILGSGYSLGPGGSTPLGSGGISASAGANGGGGGGVAAGSSSSPSAAQAGGKGGDGLILVMEFE
ncbi:hypothetical protein PAQ31011_00787 [Pandoraea aquatica]|uniref:Uncharacterized protein n=1 Tax=Pandoraea aquatica TaxID=2508290 RepID=A0A5E4SGS7_9BURK|nr:hypothetical protein [Pandoraea aquatica]VVD74371.1 hypothetical protein PAQ31011_00787 [Pandoraea aquatica]